MPLTTTQTISFHDIVPGGEVRFVVIDGKQYLSVRDVIMCICRVNNDNAGKISRRVSPQHKQELKPFLAAHQFSGRGQSVQPVLTFEGSVKLLMWQIGRAHV